MRSLSLLLISASLVWAVPTQASSACQYKIDRLEQQQEYARMYGNVHRQRGLERAIANVKRYCTDADVLREQQEDIQEQRDDIAQIQGELREHQLRNRQDKVRKLERKLAKEQQELADMEAEFEALQKASS